MFIIKECLYERITKELETVEYVVKRYLEELGKGTSYSDEELPNFQIKL